MRRPCRERRTGTLLIHRDGRASWARSSPWSRPGSHRVRQDTPRGGEASRPAGCRAGCRRRRVRPIRRRASVLSGLRTRGTVRARPLIRTRRGAGAVGRPAGWPVSDPPSSALLVGPPAHSRLAPAGRRIAGTVADEDGTPPAGRSVAGRVRATRVRRAHRRRIAEKRTGVRPSGPDEDIPCGSGRGHSSITPPAGSSERSCQRDRNPKGRGRGMDV
jgi:hypothetical protein